ncbi:EF-hand domain-containing protein [Sphingopyxis sp. Root1497]|uniref:EF-hand domain-containing protein n=1 Tax=Sphingopyxis sp. Root1497 TaxID=1736474 RepID=UPI0006F5BA75|nr:EF-hand domain-containing protein [Sphingopyxis sp. Root1497]
MNNKKAMAIGAAGLAIAVGGMVVAQVSQQRSANGIPAALVNGLNPGMHIEQYLAQIVGRLRAVDRNGDGLDRADIEFQDLQRTTQERAQNIHQVLVYDYDGDFRVTREELERGARGENDRRSEQADSTLKNFDGDGDGVVTLQEAASRERNRQRETSLDGLLELDPNGDGKLTAAELMARAEQAFKQVDRDGDGTLSKEEYAVIAGRVEDIRLSRNAETCDLPPASKDAKLVVFGAYDAEAISSAVVGGQDNETNLIDVTIEPGSGQLYVVLTSYESMIWRLRGATARVDRVVASSLKSAPGGASASGVVGLPAGKVHIARAGCPNYFDKADDSGAKRSLASIRASLQRDPDAVFATYSPRSISLPSGALTSARDTRPVLPKGFDAGMWNEAARYWPAGLAAVDPKQVVSKSKVEKYLVLPSQMGLSQLMGSGAVKREEGDTFRVLRPIAHMPPSMGGAHSITLIFPKGVPVAPGDVGHSCIVDENKRESKGARCRSPR